MDRLATNNIAKYEMNTKVRSSLGQVIGEVLIALAIGAVFITAAAGGIALYLKANYKTRMTQVAASLAQEYFDQLRPIGESNWQSVYSPPGAKGAGSQFFIAPSSSSYAIISGATTTVREGQIFTRYFSIENVNRESCGVGKITASEASPCSMQAGASFVSEDPSTQRVTAKVLWGDGLISMAQYITRARNRSWLQTDWSGGPTASGVVRTSTNQFSVASAVDYTSSTGSLFVAAGSPNGNLTSATFDASSTDGIAVNALLWLGNLPSGTSVQFQLATSNCSNGATNPPTCTIGTWGFMGPDGTATTYYAPSGPDIPVAVNLQQHNNKRYFEYKIFLAKDGGQTVNPRVDDVIVNWSP